MFNFGQKRIGNGKGQSPLAQCILLPTVKPEVEPGGINSAWGPGLI